VTCKDTCEEERLSLAVIEDLYASKSYAGKEKRAKYSLLTCAIASALIMEENESRAANERKRDPEGER
jgi:hypothetical protein